MTGIYAIRRTFDGACYVGSSASISARWLRHRRMLDAGTHHAPRLQRSWNKYGAAAHEFVLIEMCAREDLIEREQHFINTLSSIFNACRIAGSRRGCKNSKPYPKVQSEKYGRHWIGRQHSEESRAKMSASHRGKRKPLSEAGRASVVAANAARKGYVATAETRIKLSAANTGRTHTAETRSKIRASAFARWSRVRELAIH